VFAAGLAQAIVLRFGEQTPNGRFEFAAFFPTDPEGMWAPERREAMHGVMEALDHVIQRHRIDPKRVYLTGHSSGGDGVWSFAQSYPDVWAAVAPVAAFTDPDIAKVRHIPAWIFHGAKDNLTPAEQMRGLFQKLKDAKANVRYTEIPDRGHVIWREVYHRKELYDWFAAKTRP
jgi:predicted peptidase